LGSLQGHSEHRRGTEKEIVVRIHGVGKGKKEGGEVLQGKGKGNKGGFIERGKRAEV